MSADPDRQGDAAEFVEVCSEEDLWDGEMEAFDVGRVEALVVKFAGEWRAYDGVCPLKASRLREAS